MAAFSYIRILWFLFLVFRFRFILGRSSSGSSEQRCKRIEQFHGGDVTYTDSRKIHSSAFYSCDEAYSVFPRDIDYSNCTESLEWKPEPPKCMKKAKVKVSRNGFVCRGSKDIILHKESYLVCCARGYELYSDRFLERKRAKITNKNGTLVPEVPRCVEERCDPADQYMADVHYQNGTKIKTKFTSRTSVYLSCKDGYEYYRSDQELKTPLMRKCVKGNIKNTPICREGKCLFSGIPTNSYTFHREYLGDAQLVAEDQLMYPNDTVEVFCLNTKEYELYVNTTQTYVEEFTSKCRFGNFDKKKEDFPICLERRCSFDVSTGSCYWVQDEEKCLPEIFTIPSQSSVNLTCKFGYKLFRSEEGHNVEVTEDASIFCNKGVHSPVYECIPEKCTVPTVKHAWLLSKGANIFENGEKISFICDKEFHFYQNISTTVDMFETTCSLGNWTDNIPNECIPDGCKLNVSKGYRYIAENAKEIPATELMEHRTAVDLQCLEMFDLFDKNDNIFLDKGYIPTVTCYQGTWQNEHFCRERCVAYNVTNGRLTKNGEIVKAGETVVHGETVSVKCDDVVNDSVLSMKCLKGEWHNLIDCTGEGSSQTQAFSTDESTTTDSIVEYDLNDLNTTPVSIGTVSQEVNHIEDVLPENNISAPDKQNKGCKLSDDSRYSYTDSDGLDKDPGSFISEGTMLTVSCSNVDLYEFYTNYYDSYDAYSESDTTVTCIDNELSDFDLDCPEVSAEACFHLQNGRVRSENGYFYVSCDRGYSLDLILPEKTQCTCENGKLRNEYGGQEPKCVPDKCVVPYEIDQRLSVTDRFRVSLSGGSVVEIGSFVFFNCSKTDASIYEPLNRRFKCYNGLWLEAERDINWKFGFNGEFPSCREAICEPNCTNGGVCYKDDNCRCKHLTEGKRCEKFLCEEECVRNGGECSGPGTCSCPKERTGRNCEHNNCVVPTDIDRGLSMTDRNSVSLLGSDFIVSGTFVYFNCSQKGELTYEPSNRRFQCLNGRWTEADSDSSWKLGNNGMFPQCREVMCDDECKRNGGTCVGPRKCLCLKGRSGPNCEHINCVVPTDIDRGMSMTDKNRTSLLGSDYIVSGTFVYFKCSQRGGLIYEPSNRRLQCLEGRWIEADSYSSWKLENNGQFPNCREAICDEKCNINGGKCVGHGKCSCSEGRYGPNCEHSHHKKCFITFDAGHGWYPKWKAIHALKGRHSYSPGEKRSPSECQQACLNQRKIRCKSVYFHENKRLCWCLTVSDLAYFGAHNVDSGHVYFLSCSGRNLLEHF